MGTRAATTGTTIEFQPRLSEARVFWERVYVLTMANLKSRYRKTWAGFFWVVLNPLLMYGVQAKIFGTFLHLQVPNYAIFLLSGLLPWIFINQTVDMGAGTFVNSGRMLKSIQVPPLVYLLAQLVDNLVNFSAAFLILLIPVTFFGPVKLIGVLLLPLPILFLILGALGLTWILATVQVFFRDTRFVMTFVMSVTYFVTPIFYPIAFIPPGYRWIVSINVFYYLIQPFRLALYDFNPGNFFFALAQSAAVSLAMLGLAAWIWKKKQNAIYFNI